MIIEPASWQKQLENFRNILQNLASLLINWIDTKALGDRSLFFGGTISAVKMLTKCTTFLTRNPEKEPSQSKDVKRIGSLHKSLELMGFQLTSLTIVYKSPKRCCFFSVAVRSTILSGQVASVNIMTEIFDKHGLVVSHPRKWRWL